MNLGLSNRRGLELWVGLTRLDFKYVTFLGLLDHFIINLIRRLSIESYYVMIWLINKKGRA